MSDAIYAFGDEPHLKRDASRQARMEHACWELDIAYRALTATLSWLKRRTAWDLEEDEVTVLGATLVKIRRLHLAACEDIEALGKEMSEWRDKIKDYFGHTEKFQTISATAAILADAVRPLQSIDPDTWDPTRYTSRYRDLSMLEGACDNISDFLSEVENAEFPGGR